MWGTENVLRFDWPIIPEEIRTTVFNEDDSYIAIGILGKSQIPNCNKMDAFEVLDMPASLSDTSQKCYCGRIIFYIDRVDKLIYLHFDTSYDGQLNEDMIKSLSKDQDYFSVNAAIQSKFAQIFLFAANVCHLLVLTDSGSTFDSNYSSLFRALSTIREKNFLKYAQKSHLGNSLYNHLGKELRLCPPKIIFLFEKPTDMEIAKVEEYEFDLENEIYTTLKGENLLSKNTCLFVLPKKIAFVHVNRSSNSTLDPVKESMDNLMQVLNNFSQGIKNEDPVEPYIGFGRAFHNYSKDHLDSEIEATKVANQVKKYSVKRLIRKHVREILSSATQGVTEGEGGKSRSTSHRINIPTGAVWLEIFELMHQMLLGQDDNPDPEYKIFIEHFNRLIDVDGQFFQECCQEGYKKALKLYEMNLRTHYSLAYHEQKLQQSYAMYLEYARGPKVQELMEKLKDACDLIWTNNRQLCESLSLRGNPCIMPKISHTNPLEHTSGVVFVSTCNCGRTQARREDPYVVKQANFDFYQINNCSHCLKAERRITFPVFHPSTNDFCAANISISPDHLKAAVEEEEEDVEGDEIRGGSNNTTPLTQQSHSDLSYEEFLNRATPEEKKKHGNQKVKKAEQAEEDLNEIVVKVGELKMDSSKEEGHFAPEGIARTHSTTEYLPGMVTTTSPVGLLPQFPSWSLICIGRSLLYSHNTGIQEHFQGKFLSNANYLLPWNVHVRLENASNWTQNYERSRKKQVSHNPNVFQLKIFFGLEYECPKGHRFFMSGPDKIVTSNDITTKNVGSKVAYNDMPLYYPCRCQTGNSMVAQLMRVHVVTPKAPVNIILEPKVRIGNRTTNPLIFTTGLPEPVKLSQSDYWVLRLPYVYQTDEAPILPPQQVDPDNALIYGCLLAGLFGIVESEEQCE